MDVKGLEARLEGGEETQSFDVKGPMPWSDASLAKDILAMANVRDGGTILIGVHDKTFAREGVDQETRRTYDVDVMRDQMTKYADPHVIFGVDFPTDGQGRTYVAIEVEPFREIPVICRVDSHKAGLKRGTIYYRNSNRRPESAPVSNSYDMRDIVTVAAARTRRRLDELGVTQAEDRLQVRLDAELGDL